MFSFTIQKKSHLISMYIAISTSANLVTSVNFFQYTMKFSTRYNRTILSSLHFCDKIIHRYSTFFTPKSTRIPLGEIMFLSSQLNTFQDLLTARFVFWTPVLVSRFKPAIGPWKVDRRQTAAYCEAEQPENKISSFKCIGIINLISLAFKMLFLRNRGCAYYRLLLCHIHLSSDPLLQIAKRRCAESHTTCCATSAVWNTGTKTLSSKYSPCQVSFSKAEIK